MSGCPPEIRRTGRDPKKGNPQLFGGPELGHRIADRHDLGRVIAVLVQDPRECLDLGRGRARYGAEEICQAALADDRAQFVVRRARHDVHVDLALGGGQQRIGALDERAFHHGAEHELRIAPRQSFDALRIAGTAEQLALILREFRAPRRPAVKVRVPHQFLHLGGYPHRHRS